MQLPMTWRHTAGLVVTTSQTTGGSRCGRVTTSLCRTVRTLHVIQATRGVGFIVTARKTPAIQSAAADHPLQQHAVTVQQACQLKWQSIYM
jgi:hypothetical protein